MATGQPGRQPRTSATRKSGDLPHKEGAIRSASRVSRRVSMTTYDQFTVSLPLSQPPRPPGWCFSFIGGALLFAVGLSGHGGGAQHCARHAPRHRLSLPLSTGDLIMIGRVLLAALLAGIAAGLIMGCHPACAADAHDPGGGDASRLRASGPRPCARPARPPKRPRHRGAMTTAKGWAPADGWQRTLSTTAHRRDDGRGLCRLLAAMSLLSGLAITRRNGMSGACAASLP